MTRLGRVSLGLFGRLLAILLLVLLVELASDALVYHRASRALLRDDEAHRLAEHLDLARRLLGSERPDARARTADMLTTGRYAFAWSPAVETPGAPPTAYSSLRARMLDWEPALQGTDLRLSLAGAGRQARLAGALRLPDRTWLRFQARVPDDGSTGYGPVLATLLPFAALLLVATLLFHQTLRPMRMLALAAERIGQKGASPRLPEAGPGEVRRVIRAFNAMQSRIRQLIDDRTQALAAVGHDLRTPLSRLQLRSDSIPDPALRHAVGADVAEMEAMVDSLLSFLRGADDPETPKRTDVAILAATVADDAADHGADVVYEGQPHLEATVRPVALKRAIVNLVENAVHYGERARVTVLAASTTLTVRIDDEGPGIPPDRLHEAVQPFARLDAARLRNTGGLGLGLAIVARAMEAEGGTLVLANRAEGGLRAELRLPLR